MGLGQVQNGHYQKSTAKTAGGNRSFKGLIVEESYECILSFLCIMKLTVSFLTINVVCGTFYTS